MFVWNNMNKNQNKKNNNREKGMKTQTWIQTSFDLQYNHYALEFDVQKISKNT